MRGADVAIITAASPSAEPIELAANISRDRGRIVVVGTVNLGVSRKAMYRKELSLVLSRSYGPGRYDPEYEELGLDYPVGYVRWTEKRNMEAFLDLLASGARHQCDAYDREVLSGGAGRRSLSGVKRHRRVHCVNRIPWPGSDHDACSGGRTGTITAGAPCHRTQRQELKIGCIGAGSFARDTIFPALLKTRGVALHSVATASGVASESARRLFNFTRAVQPTELLQDKDTDAVFVLSRHDSHAQYVLAALANQKPVFVEKPLAISREQLEEVRGAIRQKEKRATLHF